MRKFNFVKGIKFIAIITLCAIMSTLLCISFMESAVSARAETTGIELEETLLESSNCEKVVSYEDIFQEYYQQTVNAMAEYDIEMPYSFEEFCDGYYQLGMDLSSYCDFLVAEANGTICMADYEVSTESSSDDEDYIIKGDTSNPSSSKFDPDITPSDAFQRDVYYTNENFDYSAIQDGDIVVETNTKFSNMGHSALIYDVNKRAEGRIHGRSTYIQVIEAVGGGVQFGVLDDDRMVKFGVIILRPIYTSPGIVEQAKYFHWCQLGKPYDLPLDKGRVNTSINSASWYCSELNYAGYLYARSVIAFANSGGWIWPFDLTTSSHTNYVSFSKTLDARLYGKEKGKWKIRVYNNTGNTVSMYYNAKLAFEGDAKNWSGLKDVNSTPITINNNGFSDVYISTNVFATTAAISHTIGNKRYVTYCYELNDATLRMAVHKNVVTI